MAVKHTDHQIKTQDFILKRLCMIHLVLYRPWCSRWVGLLCLKKIILKIYVLCDIIQIQE